MLLTTVVETSAAVAATRSRLTKRALLADLLRLAGPGDVEVVSAWLAGAPRQRRTGVGWRSLSGLPAPADEPTLEVAVVDATLEELSTLSGPGSQATRRETLHDLFARATEPEQRYLVALISENLRQGSLDALLLDAVAEAADVPLAAVRRAAMFSAETGPIARAALSGGVTALEAFGLRVGRPLRPMLASPATHVADAASRLDGEFSVDAKLDGIRVQVHRDGDDVRIFTRSLDDITERLPEVVAATLALPCTTAVLDGEALAFDETGRPRPFQETASRTMSSADVPALAAAVPVTPSYFDLVHLDGEDLLLRPASERFALLERLVPEEHRTPRLVTSSVDEAQAFFDRTVASGHEGVVCKDLAAPYDAGRRGSAWLKVKPRHTLDLVVLAVEWGSGRRQGWLSNLHLGARDGDGFVMLGKTFKGMTDAMLTWQTERFLELETHRQGHVVHVRPEQVVEIAFDGLQRSTRYPGGLALRFARVLRYREDKTAAEADTIDTVRAVAG